MKFITYSGFPANFLRSSGFCVATPTGQTADMKVLMKELMPALEKKQKKSIQLDVTNIDRTFGTIFG